MAVDYTPTLGSYKELKPFRYWCQKVLPLVYDDSLSYYELLCKVVDYLNKTMEDVDTLHDDVVALHEAYTELQSYVNDYFDNLDVQTEIDAKLDAMASSGALSNLIEPFIPDIVSDWLDEHITPTTPAIDNTLTVSGAGADAKVTGDKFTEDRILTNTLNGDNAITLSDFDGSVAINGAYAKRVNDKLALYGTEAGSRYLRCLNGEIAVYTSQMSFYQTLPAGKYKVNLTSDNFTGDLYLAYTSTIFANASYVTNGDIIITDVPIMVAFFVPVNTVYGTENNPTLINISLTKYEEKVNVSSYSEVTERTKNLIRFENIIASESDGYSGFTALQNGFTEDLPAGTYTLSFIVESDTDINYIYLGIYKTSASQTVNRMIWQQITKSGEVIHFTFTVAEPIKSIYFWAMPTQSESQNHVVTIKAIQLERGADYSDIIQHNITAIDYIARNEIDKLKIGESIKTYTLFKDGYINTSGSTIDPNSPTASSEWSHIIIPCKENDEFIFNCVGGDYEKLLYAFCDSSNNIISRSYSSGLLSTYSFPAYTNLHSNKAPVNASYVVVNHHKRTINGYEPKVYKLSDSEIKNYLAKKITSELPYEAPYTWQNQVVATLGDSIVINDNGILKLSTDLGETWNNGLDVSSLGELVNYHLYNNGTLGFFSVTNAYYTSDWQTYHNAPCYETNGNTYTPQNTNNFNSLWDHKERKVINGSDMYVFGNYDTSTPHLRALVWYSIDQGHSYKIAYEFDLPSTFPARHVHDVIYYEPEDVFIVGTGDSNATECSIFALSYNTSNDTWNAEKLGGSARGYKWANMAIYRDEIYYAYDNTPGAVKKCKYDNIGNLNQHETVIDGLENDTLSLAFSDKGELIIIQSYARSTAGQTIPIDMTDAEASRLIYYSSDRKHFNCATLPLNFINGFAPQCRVLPILSNGKCFIGIDRSNRIPSVDIGDFLNTVGFPQAFKDF